MNVNLEEAVGPAATRIRWHIIALLLVIAALTYLDRLNLSIAGKYIQDEFALSTETMGWILSAFILGYSLFQVPGGWLGDRYGPRGVLTLAILWWSLFTAATGLAPRLPMVRWFGLAWSLAIIRFTIGMGEAATFPNTNKIVAYWMGGSQRGVGQSLAFAGIGLGGTMTPIFIAWLMQRWGWRISFYACAAMGFAVALSWRLYATNRPEEHPGVNAAELTLIRAGSPDGGATPGLEGTGEKRLTWGKMLSNVSVWALSLSASCIAYPAYIFYTWFFIYLIHVRHLTVMQGGFWGSTPFLGIVLLAPLGGWVSDALVAKFGRRRGRQRAIWLGICCSGALLWAGGHTASNPLAILLLAGAAGFNLFATATLWAACIDLSPNFSGRLSGLMNTCGTFGGWLSPILTARIATRSGWTQALDFAAAVTFLAAVVWVFVNANDNLEE